MFTLTESDLDFLARQNGFPVPATGMIFVGLRGALPVAADAMELKKSHTLETRTINHTHLRCTLIQWMRGEGFACFPGSTVPSQKSIKAAVLKNGSGANMQMTGWFTGYVKGRHKGQTATGHDAFRNEGKLPVRRTVKNDGYGNDDHVDTRSTPFNNIHAAWAMSVNAPGFSSAGCQVIEGYPRSSRRGDQPDTGAWKNFRARAYAQPQTNFGYMLLTGTDAQRRAASRDTKQVMRLRYGSEGDAVAAAQSALTLQGWFDKTIDGKFGMETLKAILAFQTEIFGKDADDGIIGPQTADALGIALPEI